MADDPQSDKAAADKAPRQTPPSAEKARPRQGLSKLRRFVLPLALAGATGAAAYARRRSSGESGDGLVGRAKQMAGGALEKVQEVTRVKDAATAVASKVGKGDGAGDGSRSENRATAAPTGGEADAGDVSSGKRRELPVRDPRELEAARRERQARREERRKQAEA